MVEAYVEASGADYVVDEFADFHDASFGGAACAFGEEVSVVVAHEGDARCRRADYVVVGLERLFKMLGERSCFIFEAGISHGLPAAGLPFGVFHINAEFLQKVEGGHSDCGKDRIDVAGYE